MTTPSEQRAEALLRDCMDLTRYIARARREISQLRPEELKSEKIPRAGKELEAIVKATEEATDSIMSAAEEVMAADSTAPDYKSTVEAACMTIFEACSFQDITGQRITKVVNTLTYIEERLNKLQSAWGPDGIGDAEPAGDPRSGDAALLNGPALAGEGVNQAEVDALLNEAEGKKPSQADIDALFD